MTKMYLAILNDRHIDPDHSIHVTLKGAMKKCREWMDFKGYREKGYRFKPGDVGAGDGWTFYHSVGDEGPRLHIEPLEVRP